VTDSRNSSEGNSCLLPNEARSRSLERERKREPRARCPELDRSSSDNSPKIIPDFGVSALSRHASHFSRGITDSSFHCSECTPRPSVSIDNRRCRPVLGRNSTNLIDQHRSRIERETRETRRDKGRCARRSRPRPGEVKREREAENADVPLGTIVRRCRIGI